ELDSPGETADDDEPPETAARTSRSVRRSEPTDLTRGGQMLPPARQESYHAPDSARVAQGELSEQAVGCSGRGPAPASGTAVASRLSDVERNQRLVPTGAVVPVGTIAPFGFNFAPG